MPVFAPGTDPQDLRRALARPDALLVVCFCAAWCDTCTAYQARFTALAEARADHTYLWIDIEEHAEALGNEDIENFPTLLIQADQKTLFFGPMLPHIGHLERLLASLTVSPAASADAVPVRTGLPDLRDMYAGQDGA